jgi:hypothetical protein
MAVGIMWSMPLSQTNSIHPFSGNGSGEVFTGSSTCVTDDGGEMAATIVAMTVEAAPEIPAVITWYWWWFWHHDCNITSLNQK